jgi:hypothetical protein
VAVPENTGELSGCGMAGAPVLTFPNPIIPPSL